MAKPTVRIGAVQFAFALGILAILVRSAQLQIGQRDQWTKEAEWRRTERSVLPARRGTLFDRNRVPLAITQEFYHVDVALTQFVDTAAAVRLLARHLDVGGAVQRGLKARKRDLYFHGPYTATQVQALRGVAGVHLTGEYRRFNPSRDLARPIVGGLLPDGTTGGSGLELSLDSMLTGRPGEAVLLKDRNGRRYSSPSRLIREPVAGNDVVLTIDAELQEIAERGLADALAETKAEGGDIVFLDPATGELLALASRQALDQAPRASTFTDPFEPGSTAKLFTAAALLANRRVDSTVAVAGENGEWLMPVTASGRTRRITDSHKSPGNLTLAQALQVSSNIAMAKFSLRLSPEEQFEMLRDFGFGSPSGAEFPSESRGRLARPDRWQPNYTRASMAMGYEFGVTPVQLAAAYGAIANDGLLLTPSLVRDVWDPSGKLLYRRQPEPVRRVVEPAIAARLREYLRGAAGDSGTGGRAQLATFSLIGKTGTAVRFRDGRYVQGEYTASFAALFPADDPQLVVIVKIDNPKGRYYGGEIAAPVTRTMLQQALASRRIAIDRRRLASASADTDTDTAMVTRPPRPKAPSVPVQTIPWPYRSADSAAAPRTVPDVAGRSVREAALALHRRGFRVSVRGFGRAMRTSPASGASAAPGALVVVWTE